MLWPSLALAAGGWDHKGYVWAEGARVVRGERADELFAPGSVHKLVLACAALHYLGPEYRVPTGLGIQGLNRGGILQGDLVLQAGGDPTWNRRFSPAAETSALQRLATLVKEAGLRRVQGDLVVDLSAFPGRSLPLSRTLADLPFAFAAPASALAVNENTVQVRIAPGKEPGEAGVAVSRSRGLKIEHRIRTVGPERHGKGTVDFRPDWRQSSYWIAGEYPVSEPSYTVALAAPAPELRAARAFRDELVSVGVTVEGEIHLRNTVVEVTESLGEIHSPPLRELLPVILEDSNNWYAEMLLRVLARAERGAGRLDTGLDLLSDFLLREAGLSPGTFVLDDASGLSPYNALTPRAVARLLAHAWNQPWRGTLVAALARPGKGTLEAWPAMPPLSAKTGTLRHALGLAGYLDPEPGSEPGAEPKIFVYLLRVGTEEKAGLRSAIARQIASMRAQARAAPATP